VGEGTKKARGAIQSEKKYNMALHQIEHQQLSLSSLVE
jgi:hypothetical protein